MAARLEIAREWLSKLENGRQPVSAAVTLKYLALDREAGFTFAEPGRNPDPGMAPARVMEEPPAGRAATRRDCEAYLREVLERADRSADPNAFPFILRTLQKYLPLADFSPTPPRAKAQSRASRRS